MGWSSVRARKGWSTRFPFVTSTRAASRTLLILQRYTGFQLLQPVSGRAAKLLPALKGELVAAGVNSSNVVDSGNINSLKPGDPEEFVLNPRYPSNMVTQANATVEQLLPGRSVLRMSYPGTTARTWTRDYLNNPMSAYVL